MRAMLTAEEAAELARTHAEQMKQRLPVLRGRIAHVSATAIARARDTLRSGGGGAIASDGTTVEVAAELTTAALERLAANRTCALHVKGFADPETCESVASWMLETCRFEKWEELIGKTDLSDMFFGVGIPVNALAESPARCIDYFDQAVPTIRRIRAAAKGRLSPIDKLRLELDELWAHGANVRVDPVYKKKMLVGLGRLMKPEGMVGESTKTRGIVHVDASPRIRSEAGLFTANVYLRTPAVGGELDVWSVTPSRIDAMYLGHHLQFAFDPENRERTQALLRTRLPEPWTIAVRPGDLVLFNAGRPHAVRGFPEGVRVTLQSFLDHRRDQPLTLFA